MLRCLVSQILFNSHNTHVFTYIYIQKSIKVFEIQKEEPILPYAVLSWSWKVQRHYKFFFPAKQETLILYWSHLVQYNFYACQTIIISHKEAKPMCYWFKFINYMLLSLFPKGYIYICIYIRIRIRIRTHTWVCKIVL